MSKTGVSFLGIGLAVFVFSIFLGLFWIVGSYLETVGWMFGVGLRTCRALWFETGSNVRFLILSSVVGLSVIGLVKLVLSLVFTLVFVAGNRKNSGLNQAAKLKKILGKHDLPKDRFVVVKERGVAASVGLFRPRVFLSREVVESFSPRQLEAVVLHEWYHTANNHSLVYWMVRVLCRTLFFLPVFVDLKRFAVLKLENMADEYVVKAQETGVWLEEACGEFKTLKKTRNVLFAGFLSGQRKAYPWVSITRVLVSLVWILTFLSTTGVVVADQETVCEEMASFEVNWVRASFERLD